MWNPSTERKLNNKFYVNARTRLTVYYAWPYASQLSIYVRVRQGEAAAAFIRIFKMHLPYAETQ